METGCGGREMPFNSPSIVSDNGWNFGGAIADLRNVTIWSSDCPVIYVFFGSFKMNTTSYENVTVMSCSEHIEEVQASTTLTLPNLAIDPYKPPIVSDASTKLLQNTTSNLTALQFFIGEKFNAYFVPFYSNTDSGADQRPIDLFFQALTLGSEVVSPSELLGLSNADKLLDRVTYLYRKYMAQLISTDMCTAPLFPHPTYNATIDLPTARLILNPGAKSPSRSSSPPCLYAVPLPTYSPICGTRYRTILTQPRGLCRC